jgi:hypothetical protein
MTLPSRPASSDTFPFQGFSHFTLHFLLLFGLSQLIIPVRIASLHLQLHKSFLLISFPLFLSVFFQHHHLRIFSSLQSLLFLPFPIPCSIDFSLAFYFPTLKVGEIFVRNFGNELEDWTVSHSLEDSRPVLLIEALFWTHIDVTRIYVKTKTYTMLQHNTQSFYTNPDMFWCISTSSSGGTHLTLKTHKHSC